MKESTSKASSASSLKAKSAQKTAAANKRKIADLEAQVHILNRFSLVDLCVVDVLFICS